MANTGTVFIPRGLLTHFVVQIDSIHEPGEAIVGVGADGTDGLVRGRTGGLSEADGGKLINFLYGGQLPDTSADAHFGSTTVGEDNTPGTSPTTISDPDALTGDKALYGQVQTLALPDVMMERLDLPRFVVQHQIPIGMQNMELVLTTSNYDPQLDALFGSWVRLVTYNVLNYPEIGHAAFVNVRSMRVISEGWIWDNTGNTQTLNEVNTKELKMNVRRYTVQSKPAATQVKWDNHVQIDLDKIQIYVDGYDLFGKMRTALGLT